MTDNIDRLSEEHAAMIYAIVKTDPEESVEERERWYQATSCTDPDCETCAYRRGHMFGLPPLTAAQKKAAAPDE